MKSIVENDFSNLIIPSQFVPECQPNVDKLMDDIKNLFATISSCNLEDRTIINSAFLDIIQKPVEVSNEKKKHITSFAEAVNVKISKSFFSLGNLTRDQIPYLAGGGSLVGTEEENCKYNDINKLNDMINELLRWISFEKQFKGYKCIKLAVVNEGTTFDEDIDITLRFPKKALIKHDMLPVIEEGTLSSINDYKSLFDIFEISTTVLYSDYDSSKTGSHLQKVSSSYVGMPFYAKDYESEYRDTMDDVFDYQYFQEAECMIIRLHIDYLKHNNSVAFPTVIFVEDDIEKITFSISSKHSGALIDGELNGNHP